LVPDACCGLYVSPELPPLEGDPQDRQLNADQLEADESGNVILLRGGVEIRHEDTLMRGGNARYDLGSETAVLDGGITVRHPGVLITGDSATVERNAGRSRIEQASYVLHEEQARGSAEVIVYTDEDGVVTIDNGYFTRCEPGDDSWMIRGDEIRLYRDTGRGIARNLTLQVGKVPVFYLPWISFPISDERATGFLAPIAGTTRYGGLDFAAPYYLNLAPNYDMTLTPRVFTERGVMLGVEGRYLGRGSSNEIDMAWLPDDDRYDPAAAARPGSGSPPKEERWLVDYLHFGRLGGGWNSYIDYAAVSDEYYFQDLSSSGLDITTQSFLPRAAQLSYTGATWRFTTSALGYQVIDP